MYAREEARPRGDRRVGTEHLVLGLLREPDIAQALGCDLGAAGEALDAMDRDSPVAIGINRALGAPPVPTREPVLGSRRPSLKAVLADRLPMTPVAKRVLEESGPREFAAHSLRSGYATQAERDGHHPTQIGATTRHQDQRVLAGYIRAGRGRDDIAHVL